jgi:hypothetical protein
VDVFPFELLNQEHERIHAEATRRGVILRLLGALAFELRCPQHTKLRSELGRELSDLDYMALSGQWEEVVSLLTGLNYSFDERRAMLHGHERIIFFHPEGVRVDVFFNKLDMCHEIDLRQRLTVHDHTLSLADLLLEKLQIVRITEKDIIDMIVLFLEHPLSEDESGIHKDYIADRLSGDWGFYHTATTNLRRLKDEFITTYPILSDTDQQVIRERVTGLLQAIEATPKSAMWKVRARVGTSVKWYKDVGELER